MSLLHHESAYFCLGAAVVIEDNDELEIIEMKSLEIINSDDPTTVIIRQPNTKLTLVRL